MLPIQEPVYSNQTDIVVDIEIEKPAEDFEETELDIFDESYYDTPEEGHSGRELAKTTKRSYYSKKEYYSKTTTTTTTYTPPKYVAVYKPKKTSTKYIPPPASKPASYSRSSYYKPSGGATVTYKPKPKKELGFDCNGNTDCKSSCCAKNIRLNSDFNMTYW